MESFYGWVEARYDQSQEEQNDCPNVAQERLVEACTAALQQANQLREEKITALELAEKMARETEPPMMVNSSRC